jgi:predicted nucleotidyltransferase
MERNILNTPDIEQAVNDLRSLLVGIKHNIEDVSLFGSTVTTPIHEAHDIDFFVAYRDASFDDVRKHLISVPLIRRVVVESLEATYTNHPDWPRELPLRMHIILYRKGLSKFSAKLERTRVNSINITKAVL